MKLRLRALIYIATAMIALFACVYFASSKVLLQNYLDLERRETSLNADRAYDSITTLTGTMSEAASDWGSWDDTYKFMSDKNSKYIHDNLETFVLKLDLVLYIDAQGRLFYSRPIDRTEGVKPPSDKALIAALKLGKPTADSKGLSGLVLTPDGPVMTWTRPILTSTGKGPARGWLVFAKYLERSELAQVADRTHLALSTYVVGDKILPADCRDALLAFDRSSEKPTIPLNEKTIAGYALLRDVHNNPALLVRVTQPRSIYDQGRLAVQYLLVVTIVAGLLFGLTLIAILEVTTLSRLSKLHAQVSAVGNGELDSVAVHLSGKDELASLASNIDHVVADLKKSRHDLSTKNDELESLVGKLAASNEILENALDGVALLDNHGTLISCNAAFAELLGYEIEETFEMPWHDILLAEHVEGFQLALDRANTCFKIEEEFAFRKKDGSILYGRLGMLSAELPDVEGYFTHLFLRDISDAKQIEAANLERVRAEQANDAKSDFLSRMSHELRTPLNAILGFAQLLEMEIDDKEHQEMLAHILSGGHHLLSLINEVLDISRIESKTFQVSLEPVGVNRLIDETVSLVSPIASQRCITVEVEHDAGDIWVTADVQRLRQAVLNLLSNAIKYNRPQGSVVVSFSRTEDGHAWIHVRDTGYGIPPAMRVRLFIPFDRLGADQSDIQGTGLGLALTKRLVECMHGEITLEDAPGGGSVFSLRLPLCEAPGLAASDQRAAASAVPEHGEITVLYIEDNFSNAVLMKGVANKLGFKLVTAAQGQLGYEQAIALLPDLILLDLDLPDLPGTEVLAMLKSAPETAHIRVVIVSADASSGRVDRLKDSGADGYIAKPFAISDIQSVVFPDGVADAA